MALDWKSVIGAVAPVLGTALGGPYAGMALKSLCEAVGLSGDATESEISARAATDPEFALKAREAENNFKLKMQEFRIQEEQLVLADKDSARKREMTVKDHAPAAMAAFITLGFFGVLSFLLMHGMPEKGGEALLVMLGALGGAFISVVQYYFGSSSGSARKTELLKAGTNG